MFGTDPYLWQEVGMGRWERDIDEAEQFYASLARLYEGTGRMFFAITGHVSVDCMVPEGVNLAEFEVRFDEGLRRAWLALRYDHPAIASRIIWDQQKNKLRKVYKTFGHANNTTEDWLRATFQIISNSSNGQEWCNSDPPSPVFPTLFVIQPATTDTQGRHQMIRRDLVLRSPHDTIDGIGTLMLFGCLLEHAAKTIECGTEYVTPSFGNEWTRLNPPLRMALDLPSQLSDQIRSLYDTIAAQNADLGGQVEILTVPRKYESTVPGKHLRVEVNLSAEETAEVLSACKRFGVSVTHAYHAAAVLALCKIQPKQPESRQTRYINYGLVNLRDNCLYPYNTAKYAASVYHCVSPNSFVVDVRIPAAINPATTANSQVTSTSSQDFPQVLSTTRSFYQSIRDDKSLPRLSPLIWQQATPAYVSNDTSTPPVPPPNDKPSVSISSMGIIDRMISSHYGPLQVHNPWVTGEELGNGLGLFLGTFRGQLSLSAAFNEAWHDSVETLDFLHQCNATVREGLHVEIA